MPPLDRVYAYRDQESMGPTRWAPRKVYCTRTPDHQDAPGTLHVVKFCQGKHGAAAMISEVLCRELYRAGGIAVLDAFVVCASSSFADSWNGTPGLPFKINPGLYFGTRYLDDVMPGPPIPYADLEDPGQLLDIWVFDSWVCNIDRPVLGNLLMTPLGRKTRWRLIASDQSDCFCGSELFSNGEWRERMRTRPQAACVKIPEAIADNGGTVAIQNRIEKARVALASFGAAVDQVPPDWWELAKINPEVIEEALLGRLDDLPRVLNVEQWGEFDYGQFDGIPII